ncbi:MAG: GNAT family N-acetyltransferase [Pseudomonadota bacterium]
MTADATHSIGVPILRTERLTLRAPQVEDAPAYAAFYASERSHIIGGPLGETAAWKVLTNDVGHWTLRGYGWWSIDDGSGCVGSCGFHLPAGRPAVEIGWSLFSATGKGYATKAAKAALAWADGRFAPLVSHIDRANAASQAVAKRLGAHDTGTASAHDPDCNIWAYGAAA